jgi:hypothetical protein
MNAIILKGAALRQPPLPQSGPRAKTIAHPCIIPIDIAEPSYCIHVWSLSQHCIIGSTHRSRCIIFISFALYELVGKLPRTQDAAALGEHTEGLSDGFGCLRLSSALERSGSESRSFPRKRGAHRRGDAPHHTS